MFKKKTQPSAPTHEERFAVNAGIANSAVSVFEQAARDLELAATLHDEHLDQIADELAALYETQASVAKAFYDADDKATRIRNLIG